MSTKGNLKKIVRFHADLLALSKNITEGERQQYYTIANGDDFGEIWNARNTLKTKWDAVKKENRPRRW